MVKHKDLTPKEEIKVLQRLSQTASAWALGCTARTLRERKEIPRVGGRYDARELLQWAVRRAVERGPEVAAETKEKLDLQRLRKLQIANDKAMGILRPARDVHDVLFELGSRIRGAGEKLQRDFGTAAWQILNDVLDKFDEELKALQTSGKGAGNEETIPQVASGTLD